MNPVVEWRIHAPFNDGQQLSVEKLDDIPLLISRQQQLGLSQLIDDAIPRHWRHLGLSVGQLVIG